MLGEFAPTGWWGVWSQARPGPEAACLWVSALAAARGLGSRAPRSRGTGSPVSAVRPRGPAPQTRCGGQLRRAVSGPQDAWPACPDPWGRPEHRPPSSGRWPVPATWALVLTAPQTRFSLKKKLFPPIPRVKQELAGSFLASLEETASCGGHPPSASQDPEDIFTVEETQSLASGPVKMVGPAPDTNPYENIPSGRPLPNH